MAFAPVSQGRLWKPPFVDGGLAGFGIEHETPGDVTGGAVVADQHGALPEVEGRVGGVDLVGKTPRRLERQFLGGPDLIADYRDDALPHGIARGVDMGFDRAGLVADLLGGHGCRLGLPVAHHRTDVVSEIGTTDDEAW